MTSRPAVPVGVLMTADIIVAKSSSHRRENGVAEGHCEFSKVTRPRDAAQGPEARMPVGLPLEVFRHVAPSHSLAIYSFSGPQGDDV